VLAAAAAPERVRSIVLAAPSGLPRFRGLGAQILRALLDAPQESLDLCRAILPAYFRCGPVRLLAALNEQRRPMEESLRRTRKPLLIVRGARDPIVPRTCVDAIASFLPGARLAEIPGAPGAHFTHPEAFAEVVTNFLGEPPEARDARRDTHRRHLQERRLQHV